MTVDPNPAPDPRLADASWLRAPETQRVLAAVTAGGGEARIVGGAVRNTLMSRPVTDIDIATTVRPEDVLARAQVAGLSAIPTGLSHGTVTVVAGHQPFEVTTLRRDVETHGRHATVAFTEDWSSDAHRRDFTINALYCDAAGRLYDHTSGLDDLAAHRVRFIGRAEDRIAEDYLRILRFYRFTAEYAEGSIDREGHEACATTQEGLDLISAERIRAELLKLLAAPHAPIVVSEMDEAGLLTRILGAPADVVTFARLAALERALGLPPDPIRRLIALAAPDAGARLRDRLRLSNAEAARISDLNLPDLALVPAAFDDAARSFIYRHGVETFRDGVLLTWARDLASPPSDPARRNLLALADRWIAPTLPVSGKDLLALGVPAGPQMGAILEQFEDWWIAAGFPVDPAVVRQRLAALINLKNE
ncbi:MAG: CCA tRNA nucleotidyltransferase [Hyphomicrobium sp.]